jgi:hypothetical protein
MAADVRIDIAAQFVGKKAFKEAETSTDRLTKNVKGLAKGLLAVYSAQKVLSYAKASVKAFAEDDKAAKALGTTLKNLGLAYGSNIGTVNGFISRLEMQTGVLDDELRPAMDRLLRATGDVTKSQELLALALDISAGTGKSVTQVSQSLQKAYLGQKQALGRLGVGLTKAELETSSFEQIQERLSVLFAGQATAAADTYAGSLAKLTVAGNNAKETIGKGLVDAIKTASGSTTIDPAVDGINKLAEAIVYVISETAKFIEITKQAFKPENFWINNFNPNAFKGMGNLSMTVLSQDTQRADALAAKKAAAEQLKIMKAQAAAAAKIAKEKRIALLIDKANLALNKGKDVFDIDQIQIAAALANQAEQLGKATSSAQVLQIANDTARLNVKKSILALEDAIASKDEAAIIAATAKLNADLKVLGALGMQNIKLQDIKSILDSLKPKDLINLTNLENALRLLREINFASKGSIPTSASLGSGIPSGDYIAPISTVGGSIEAILEYADAAAARANAFADLLDMENASAASSMASSIDLESIARSSLLRGLAGGAGVSGAVSGSRYAAQAANAYNITINTGVGDPNAIAEAIDNVLREAQQRGTITVG